jgi:DnaJ-class molecular chaperone
MFFNKSMNNRVDNNKFYNLLGVDKNATSTEIKKAYRKLAVIHHPDKGGDSEKFKEITKAFETLSDDSKRKHYDQFGEGDGAGNPADMFGQMFGHGMGMQSSNKKRGENVVHEVNLTLKEIFNGKNVNITVNRKTIDQDKVDICSQCNGQGMITQTVRMGPMIQQIQQPCSHCNGRGKSFKINHVTENIKVAIPKGAPNNHKITIYEKGDDIAGGDPGDLIVVVKEIKDEIFERKGYDLFINKDISLLEALKGFKIELKTLDDRNILITNDKVVKPIVNNSEWCNKMCDISLEPFAKAKISDEIKVKELIESGQLKDENITAFMIKGSTTYFYKDSIDKLIESIKPGNSLIYYKQRENIHCVEEEGMPYFNSPIIKGDLYMKFNIIFPDKITIDNDILIRGGFGEPLNNPSVNEIESDMEVYELVEKDPEVSYSNFKDTIKEDVEEEESGDMPHGQCAQQ